jgi:hypothetical protein
MFVRKAGAPIRLSPGLTHNPYNRMERPAKDKHCSLFATIIAYKEKIFYNIDT